MSTQTTSFAVGDYVKVSPSAGFPTHVLGVLFRITKVPVGARGVNYTAERADGVTGRGIRASADALVAANPDEGSTSPYAEVMSLPAPPPSGAVVTVTGVRQIRRGDLYVVLGDARKPGHVKLVRLGGDAGGRYFPAIPTTLVSVVEVADLPAAIAAQSR